jgi:hypothetical protein
MITHTNPVTHTARAYRETAQRLQRTHPSVVPFFDAMAVWHEHLRKPTTIVAPNDLSIVFRRDDFATKGVEASDGERQTFFRNDELCTILDRIDTRKKLSIVAFAVGTPEAFGKTRDALGVGTVAYDQMQVFGERIDRLMRVNSETFDHIGVTGSLAGRPLRDILVEMDRQTAASFKPASWRPLSINNLPPGELGQAGYGGPADVLFIDNTLSLQGYLTVRAATNEKGEPTLAIDLDKGTSDTSASYVFQSPKEGALMINALLHEGVRANSPPMMHEIAATASATFLSRAKGAGILPPEFTLGKPTVEEMLATEDYIWSPKMPPAYVPAAIERHDLRNLDDLRQRRQELSEMLLAGAKPPGTGERQNHRDTFQVQVSAAELMINASWASRMPRHSDNVRIVMNAFSDAVEQPEFTRNGPVFRPSGTTHSGIAGINYLRASFGPKDAPDILRDRFPDLHTLSPDWRRFEERANPTHFSVYDPATNGHVNFTAPERQLRNDVRAYLSHTVAEGLVSASEDKLASLAATRALHINREKAVALVATMPPATVLTVHAALIDVIATNKIRAVDRFAVTQIAKGVRAALSKETPARESAGVEM